MSAASEVHVSEVDVITGENSRDVVVDSLIDIVVEQSDISIKDSKAQVDKTQEINEPSGETIENSNNTSNSPPSLDHPPIDTNILFVNSDSVADTIGVMNDIATKKSENYEKPAEFSNNASPSPSGLDNPIYGILGEVVSSANPDSVNTIIEKTNDIAKEKSVASVDKSKEMGDPEYNQKTLECSYEENTLPSRFDNPIYGILGENISATDFDTSVNIGGETSGIAVTNVQAPLAETKETNDCPVNYDKLLKHDNDASTLPMNCDRAIETVQHANIFPTSSDSAVSIPMETNNLSISNLEAPVNHTIGMNDSPGKVEKLLDQFDGACSLSPSSDISLQTVQESGVSSANPVTGFEAFASGRNLPESSTDVVDVSDNSKGPTLRKKVQFSTGDETVEISSQLETSVSLGDHAFTQMQGDLDRQRLLGERPLADPLADIMLKQMQHKERYERLLRRAKTEDLTEVSGIGCLYQSGVDRHGRPVVIFVGKWFPFTKINLDKALLYLIQLLDPIVKGDYVIAYFHTLTTSNNYPGLHWLREVYNVLPYKYKKNLKQFYIIHPTFWTKMMTWWFTTFMAPAIKQKVHNLPGVEYLYEVMSPDQLEIPAYITEYDMTINGLRYYQPEQTAQPST
ncbi:uncharacterized protein LOC105690405 isoform X1 [Athalia rosae]|uniref:uncharacterized protein LOC105690405 isoform X1 n=1 Tax=Athalia rosae TaxID=37344 RepID=UPI0020338E01|nr:uncharacterized protein LOC105690405 isoform X1 [Athalia rosae]